jgi:hypothetical protein
VRIGVEVRARVHDHAELGEQQRQRQHMHEPTAIASDQRASGGEYSRTYRRRQLNWIKEVLPREKRMPSADGLAARGSMLSTTAQSKAGTRRTLWDCFLAPLGPKWTANLTRLVRISDLPLNRTWVAFDFKRIGPIFRPHERVHYYCPTLSGSEEAFLRSTGAPSHI